MKVESEQTTSNNTFTSHSSATSIMQPPHAHSRSPPHLKPHPLHNLRSVSAADQPPVPSSAAATASSPDLPPQNLFPISSSSAPAPAPAPPPPMGFLMSHIPQRNHHSQHHHHQHTSSTIPNPPPPYSHSRLPVASSGLNLASSYPHENPIPTVTPIDNPAHFRPPSFNHPRIPPPATRDPFRRSTAWVPSPPMLPSNNVGPGAMSHRLGNTAPRHPPLRHHVPPVTGSEPHPEGGNGNIGLAQHWFDAGSDMHNDNNSPQQHGVGLVHSGGDTGEGNTTMDAAMLIDYGETDVMKRYASRRMPRPRPRSNSLTEKEKRERHNAHTKSSRLRIDKGLGRLRDVLKKAKPEAKLSKKADIVDAAVRFVTDYLEGAAPQLHHSHNQHHGMGDNQRDDVAMNQTNPTSGSIGIGIGQQGMNGLQHHSHHHSHHVGVPLQHHEQDSSLSG